MWTVLIVAIVLLSGIVASLGIYHIRIANNDLKKSGMGFLGSIIGASTGAYSCGSPDFLQYPSLEPIG
ncbi:MAG: hypothetical protein ACYDAJ_10770 [Nitrosotalea sp.]